MNKYHFELQMKVRDYECDMQGIVNNAIYQHYMEHTRHEFIAMLGINFAELHGQGIDPVVARITTAYKSPLRSGEEFLSKLSIDKEGVKYVFRHDIFRINDGKLSVRSKVELVCLTNGRLGHSELLDKAFEPYLKK